MANEGWALTNEKGQALKQKLKTNIIPLSKYVDGKAYYGIKPGLTEAFVIDKTTKERLINEDPKSEEVIKPLLLGRDVKPYAVTQSTRFLLFMRRGININEYPAIKNYLSLYRERLEPKPKDYRGTEWKGRKVGTYKWYELQDAVDYYEEFSKPKIMYQKFQVKPAFIYDEQGLYCNDSMWIITKADKGLFALLNSKMGWYLISNYCTAIQNGYQLIYQYFGQIPIPLRLTDSQELLTHIVDQILTAKAAKPTADTSALETEIDRLVYGLYGLTDEEIAIVEGLS